ncbi:MAG: HTH domain-containing protein [Clostridium celatum]|nr:HTH domain-containing protein [Clostridium celatum]
MVTSKYVMERLQLLIEKYKFNVDTFSKLLDVKKVILSKDEKILFENSKNFGKMSDLIMMIELIGRDNADLKIGVFFIFL